MSWLEVLKKNSSCALKFVMADTDFQLDIK